MATLTTSYQRLGQTYLGTSGGSLYVRIYAKYSTQEIGNNRTKVQYQARAYYENGTYIYDAQGNGSVSGTSASTVSGSCTRPTTGETTIATTEAWVTHNTDGSKSISASATLKFPNWGWNKTASGSADLPKIPRQATTTNATNFDDESNPTITFTNQGNLPVKPYLNFYLNGTLAKRIERNVGSYSSPYTWSLTNTEREELRTLLASYNSCQVNIGLDTYSGSTLIGYSSLSRTFSIINANPIFTSSDMEYADLGGEALVGNVTTNLTGDDSKIIKGYSHLAVMIIGDAIAQKNSSISYYQLENVKKSFESDGETIILKVIDIEKYSKDTITVYAVDSRNNSTSITTNISDFINYNDIVKGNISLERSDNGTSEFVTLNYNGEFWNGDFGYQNNSLTATYKFKKTTDSTYTVGTTIITPTINNNSFSFSGLIAGDTTQHGFDRDEIYEVIVEVSDCLSKVTYSGLINAGTPAIAICGNKASIGGKYDTSLGGTQLWGDIYLNGNALNEYSTSETIIGRWIDGKTIYRKVYNISTSAGNNDVPISNISSNIDRITKLDGVMTQPSGNIIHTNYYYGANDFCNLFYSASDNKIRVRCGSAYGFGNTYLIIEYTKNAN